MEVVVCTGFIFSRASVTLLMYFRVCAVYNMDRRIALFFGFTWLSVIAGATTPFVSLEGIPIGPTKYCTTMVNHNYVLLLAVTVTGIVNDTLVVLAIVYKLGMADIRRTPTSEIYRSWKLAGRLQKFTRAFIQDSQIYYS